MFAMHFALLKGEMLLEDFIVSKPYPVLAGQQLDEVDGFNWLVEVSSRELKARLTFTNLEHLWRRLNI